MWSSFNLTLLLRFLFSCKQPRSNLLACWIHGLVCVHPNQVQRFHACILAFLHWNNLIDTFGTYPINLCTCRSKHKIFWQIPTIYVIPESPSFLQDLIILKRDFWYWACNFLKCIQLIIFFELFSTCLQNRRNRCWKLRVQQRSLHLKIHPVSSPNFLCLHFKVGSPRLF